MYQQKTPESSSPQRKPRGRWIVAGMFIFAMLVSAGLWTYWELHTRPYRTLTDRLGETFPESNPRVEGGKHRLHKNTPMLLRIVLRVPYNPIQEEAKYNDQIAEVMQIASESTDLSPFEQCEIHLFQQLPETEPVMRSQTIPESQFPD